MGPTTGPILTAAVDAYNEAVRDGETADPQLLLARLRAQDEALQQEERRIAPSSAIARLVSTMNTRKRRMQAIAYARSMIAAKIDDLVQIAAITRDILRIRYPGAAARPELSYDRPIGAHDIAEITMLKNGAVYELGGNDGSRTIVKIEAASGPEQIARERLNYLVSTWLIRGVPASEPLTDAERSILADLPDSNLLPAERTRLAANRRERPPETRLNHLGVMLKAARPPVALRVQRMNVGKSLRDYVNENTLPPGFPTPAMLEDFGRIAVFDRLMNNQDRFAIGDGAPFVNIDNIDLDATGTATVPIDNFDINGGIHRDPRAYASIRNAEARATYARGALESLYHEARMTPTPAQRERNVQQFIAGMDAAVGVIRTQRTTLNASQPLSPALTGDAAESARTQLERLIHILNDIQ